MRRRIVTGGGRASQPFHISLPCQRRGLQLVQQCEKFNCQPLVAATDFFVFALLLLTELTWAQPLFTIHQYTDANTKAGRASETFLPRIYPPSNSSDSLFPQQQRQFNPGFGLCSTGGPLVFYPYRSQTQPAKRHFFVPIPSSPPSSNDQRLAGP
jgi:hypothetical protein